MMLRLKNSRPSESPLTTHERPPRRKRRARSLPSPTSSSMSSPGTTRPMAALEANVRTIEMEGLLWGTGKLVAIGYGIKKLQITCVIVDDLVSTDLLEEKMTEFEDFVQSVDVVAFNKI